MIGCLLFSCKLDSAKKKERGETIQVVCTTGMLGDAMQNILPDNFEVKSLMGPGVDPHLYKATQGDLQKLSAADIIIYNGLHLEGKMGEIFDKLKKSKTILTASDAIPTERLINNTDFQGAHDPHLWFDVNIWKECVSYLSKEIQNELPAFQKSISEKTNSYEQELSDLNLELLEEISSLDSAKRVLITAHDAFGYFGRAYGFEVRGLQGISTVSEYGLKDVSELVSFVSDRGIKAVFVESSVSDRSLKAVIEGCAAKGHNVSIGATLYSDAMGEANTAEGTYLGMVRYNVKSIVNALK